MAVWIDGAGDVVPKPTGAAQALDNAAVATAAEIQAR